MYLLTCLNLFVTFSSEWHATDAGKAYHQNYRQWVREKLFNNSIRQLQKRKLHQRTV